MEESIRFVLDVGSARVKLGTAGDDAPRSVDPPFYYKDFDSITQTVSYKLESNIQGNYQARPYFHNGQMLDWDAAEYLWQSDLDISSNGQEYGLIMTNQATASKAFMMRACEFAFESNPKLTNFGLSSDLLLSLYSSGRTTGVVCDFGHTQTSTALLNEGFTIRGSEKVLDIGGIQISALTKRIVSVKSPFFQMVLYKEELAEDIKKHCGGRIDVNYELPDGNMIAFENCLESIFKYDT